MRSRTAGNEGMETRIAQFVRGLFFDIQTIEGVKPLEIWNGVRESEDSFEIAALVKNLYKIALPLVNELSSGQPFEVHAFRAQGTVEGVLRHFLEAPEPRLFVHFPNPPTGEADQKDLYRLVKQQSWEVLARLSRTDEPEGERQPVLEAGVFPGSLFDFKEMRIVDNELPFIIFTDKEYRVIHGIAVVYSWLIDLDGIFLETLEESDVDPDIVAEYRRFSAHVHAENPLLGPEKKPSPHEISRIIQEKLRQQDYLDLFEGVFRWFEQAQAKYAV